APEVEGVVHELAVDLARRRSLLRLHALRGRLPGRARLRRAPEGRAAGDRRADPGKGAPAGGDGAPPRVGGPRAAPRAVGALDRRRNRAAALSSGPERIYRAHLARLLYRSDGAERARPACYDRARWR